jgi:hypothetical protein
MSRRLADQLTTVADELLTLAPVQEPPVGFESRVIDALGSQRRTPRRLGRRLLLWLGPPVVAAAVTAVAAELVTRDQRTIRLPGFELKPDGNWGGAIPVSL